MHVKDITKTCPVCKVSLELRRDYFGRIIVRCSKCGYEQALEEIAGDLNNT